MSNMLKVRKQIMDWQKKHDALAPKKRDKAPDFQLRDINGNNPVNLSDFCDKKTSRIGFWQLYLTSVRERDGQSLGSLPEI